jgi:hypothetical protein
LLLLEWRKGHLVRAKQHILYNALHTLYTLLCYTSSYALCILHCFQYKFTQWLDVQLRCCSVRHHYKWRFATKWDTLYLIIVLLNYIKIVLLCKVTLSFSPICWSLLSVKSSEFWFFSLRVKTISEIFRSILFLLWNFGA